MSYVAQPLGGLAYDDSNVTQMRYYVIFAGGT
jgi:hypothetical protein